MPAESGMSLIFAMKTASAQVARFAFGVWRSGSASSVAHGKHISPIGPVKASRAVGSAKADPTRCPSQGDVAPHRLNVIYPAS